ncbi:ethionine resistance protein [Spiromyces aspiralis]|uniref:Ethionine resistance protein n=1 Tax=Spiromyces aspiralis TaxID=68401 RepID=A0ACC1HKR9_9FUNG|nr:ethionine resistance protein [Spiromyces aspiralis]
MTNNSQQDCYTSQSLSAELIVTESSRLLDSGGGGSSSGTGTVTPAGGRGRQRQGLLSRMAQWAIPAFRNNNNNHKVNIPNTSSLESIATAGAQFDPSPAAGWGRLPSAMAFLQMRDSLQELRIIFGSSLSMIAAYILQFSFNFITVMMVGHLGVNELGAASLANMGNMLIACCPAVGFGFALDTFCSTAFTASADKRAVGVHLQRGLVAVAVHMVFVIAIFWNMEHLLLLLRQDPAIAHLAGNYMRVMIFAAWPWMMFESIRRFIQAQGYAKVLTIVLAVALVIHIFATWLFVWSPLVGFGFYGAAVATVVSNWTMCLGAVIAIALTRTREAWGGWSWSCLSGMWEFYKLAIPSVVMFSCECFAFEFMNISSSYLGNSVLAAQSVLLNTALYTSQVPTGVGVSVATRVGNLIGDNRAARARLAARVGLLLAAALGAINAALYYSLRHVWGHLYSSDDKVLAIIASLMPVVGLFQLWDSMNIAAGGILRGLGKQVLSAYSSLCVYYTVAVPLSVYLAYFGPHWGAAGMWYAVSLAILLSALVQSGYIIFCVDWDKEVIQCLERLERTDQAQPICERLNDDDIDDNYDNSVGHDGRRCYQQQQHQQQCTATTPLFKGQEVEEGHADLVISYQHDPC